MGEVHKVLAERSRLTNQDPSELDEKLSSLYAEIGQLMAAEAAPDPTEQTLDPLDESTPVLPPERTFTEQISSAPDFVIATLSEIDRMLPSTPPPSEPLAKLLVLLALPSSFSDPNELVIETSRMQWATHEIDRLAVLPAQIQLGILAMLAARVQHLKRHLDDDLIPRITLAKLQRFRIERRLPVTAGLMPTPRPESGTWEEDARRWWAWLRSVTP